MGDSESSALRVIVVDDEPMIADTLALVLQSRGHSVRAAYCGEDAVAMLPSFMPNAVISDVMMPGISGIELAQYIADNYPDCKTLLISGCTDLAERSLRPILTKPIHPGEILRFIDACAAASAQVR